MLFCLISLSILAYLKTCVIKGGVSLHTHYCLNSYLSAVSVASVSREMDEWTLGGSSKLHKK